MQIDPSGFYAAAGGVDKVPQWMAFEAAWGMEAILTFALVFMVFAATDNFHAMTTAHLPVSFHSMCSDTCLIKHMPLPAAESLHAFLCKLGSQPCPMNLHLFNIHS